MVLKPETLREQPVLMKAETGEMQPPAEDHQKQEETKILPSREQAPAITLTSNF